MTGPLRSDVAFLLARAAKAGQVEFGDQNRFVGTSSNAMVRWAYGGAEPARHEYPSDAQDLAACQRTVAMAPPHRQARLRAILTEYERSLSEAI